MIRNYFKTAFRGFWKHKLFTIINIIGLSIGVTAALTIYLVVKFDLSFDKFHKDGDQIYRVVTDLSYSGERSWNSGVCGPLHTAIGNNVTGINISAPFYMLYQPNVFIKHGKTDVVLFKKQGNVVLADQRYFELFNYKWLAGSLNSALNSPNNVVLTSGQADKYFPGLPYNSMLGKIVNYDTIRTIVTGIVQLPQENTDLTFQDFISYSTSEANKDLRSQLQLTDWGSTSSSSQLFIKILPTAKAAYIETQLNGLLKSNKPVKAEDKGNMQQFRLQKLSDIHFNSNYGVYGNGRIANKTTLYGLLFIAAFILLLGCINFINLTTAQAAQRAKEIGIRKTMGSGRKQLIIQFLSETFIVVLFAVITSVAITPLVLKLFADFVPAGIKLNFLQPSLFLILVGLTVAVSLLAGFYPAIVLSGYKPITVLKGRNGINGGNAVNATLRRSLTVTQFFIAQFFIIATIFVGKQIYYALHKDLGYKKDAILIINTPWAADQQSKKQVFMNKLKAIPQVDLVSIGNAPPSSESGSSADVVYEGRTNNIKTDVRQRFGDDNYTRVYNIKLIAGRYLRAGDSTKALLINSTLSAMLGFKNPADAIGNNIKYNGYKKMMIAGVVADFYQASLHSPIKPLTIFIPTQNYYAGTFHIALKSGSRQWGKAITAMEKAWKEIYPEDGFEYHFYDETIAAFYAGEQQTSTLLSWAAALSIFISCLGLLGLTIYTTNRRTKEIGVRKILGASVVQIVALLSRELVFLILLSFAMVTPVAFWAVHTWMQNFADRTAISWWVFALSGGGMLVAAVITSSFQTAKAAHSNPVKSLRSE